jgi:SAM-dependent methyltransferase
VIPLNRDQKTVAGFGDEWARFDQTVLSEQECFELFTKYFKIFPWKMITEVSVGFDMGCGSGRWAKLVAPRVGFLHLLDPSSAIDVAKKNLVGQTNCFFHKAGVSDNSLEKGTMDFGYSLGVLHHVPDTERGIFDAVQLLKPGAPFLLYLYYALDNRSFIYRGLWKMSNLVRLAISRLPHAPRYYVCQIIAACVYWPLARLARLTEVLGLNAEKASSMPLGFYRHLSFYTMRTDALDRFGTRLEQRFTKEQIEAMMRHAGLLGIKFSDDAPYWCAVGYKGQ